VGTETPSEQELVLLKSAVGTVAETLQWGIDWVDPRNVTIALSRKWNTFFLNCERPDFDNQGLAEMQTNKRNYLLGLELLYGCNSSLSVTTSFTASSEYRKGKYRPSLQSGKRSE